MRKIIKLWTVLLWGLFLIQNLAFSQTSSPLKKQACFWNEAGDSCFALQMSFLPWNYYPWGVCLGKGSALSWKLDDLVQIAMNRWNQKYREYKLFRWDRLDVEKIPQGDLFIKSCDKTKYNIIYLKRREIILNSLGLWDSLSYYRPRFALQKLRYWKFYGVITVEKDWNPNRWGFINVMMHELGHALGLGHLPLKLTEVMATNNWGGNCREDKEICDITLSDLTTFVAIYNEPVVRMSAKEYNNYLIAKEEKKKRKLQGGGGSGSNWKLGYQGLQLLR